MQTGIKNQWKEGSIATGDHACIVYALPLAEDLKSSILAGSLLKRVDKLDLETAKVLGYRYAPLAEDDTEAPCAVAYMPCNPAEEANVLAVVHGTVAADMLGLGTGALIRASEMHRAQLMEHGIFAV